MCYIEDKIERADSSSYEVGDKVYQYQYNLYDIFEAKIRCILDDCVYVHYPDYPDDDEVVCYERILPSTSKNQEEFNRQEKIREQKERMYNDNSDDEYDSEDSEDQTEPEYHHSDEIKSKIEFRGKEEKIEKNQNHSFYEGEVVFIKDSNNELYEGVIKMIVSGKYLVKYPECSKSEEFVELKNILPNTEKNRA